MIGYCVRCKTDRGILNPTGDRAANGRDMIRGTCSTCSSKMTKFVSGQLFEREDGTPTTDPRGNVPLPVEQAEPPKRGLWSRIRAFFNV